MAVTTSTDPAPRLVAGRYRLGAVLGRGAMGAVWSAHDEVLGRPVAVKEVLLPPGIPDAEADLLRERSLREARAIAALSHPNVVTLYDVVRENGAPFVVMELVPSHSLAELLRQGPLPTERVTAVGAAVAAALQAAHAAGITHRDVKPGNVLVAHDGRIKLTDFGIARNLADQTMTATGLMLGSPAYIAPEVASGSQVNPAADLWGLGATLFAAVEGRPPYDAGDPVTTVSSVVLGEVPRPSCTGALAAVIGGLMVKDPARRMPLSEVRRILGIPPVTAPAPARPIPSTPASSWTDPSELVSPPGRPAAAVRTAAGPGQLPRGSSVQLAADPGPLPFALPADRPGSADRASSAGSRPPLSIRSTLRTALLWVLAVLVLLGAAVAAFGAARIASGASVVPELGFWAQPGIRSAPGSTALVTRRLEVAEEDGLGRASCTLSVPEGWSEFREPGVLGADLGITVRFVSPDGSELVAVEWAPGFLSDGRPADYLATYSRQLAEVVPHLIDAGREELPGGALDATFRTMEGRGIRGELRRTTYLRLLPDGEDLWVVRVSVPTEREGTGRAELFEPVVAGFAPGD